MRFLVSRDVVGDSSQGCGMIVWIVEVPARYQNAFCDELSLASFWPSLRNQNCIPDTHARAALMSA